MWNNNSSLPMSLIETILVLPHEIPLLNEHLQRVQDSVQQLSWPDNSSYYDKIAQDLLAIANKTQTPTVYRMEWAFSGYQYYYKFTSRALPSPKEIESWTLAPYQIFYSLYARTRNLKLAFRERYNRAMQQITGSKDLLLLNQYGKITESSIANLFFRINEQWFTPCLSTGCVNGVFRRHFIKEERVQPIIISIDQVNMIDEMYLGNAVRGLWKVTLL